MEKKSIGNFIATLRKAKGYTQQDLADLLSVSNKTVSSWENDNTSPDITLIPVIADIFNVTCDELIRGKKDSAVEEKNNVINNDKIIKNMIKNTMTGFINKMYLSFGGFGLFVILLIIGIVIRGQSTPSEGINILSIVLIIFAIVSYIVGLIIMITTYNNTLYKISDAEYDLSKERYLIEKKMLVLKCLYSFFILSSVFCHNYNKTLLEDDMISEKFKETLNKNIKIKKIFTSIGLIIILANIIGIAIVQCLPRYYFDMDVYTLEEMNTVTITKDSNGYVYITHVGIKKQIDPKMPLGIYNIDLVFTSNDLQNEYMQLTDELKFNYVGYDMGLRCSDMLVSFSEFYTNKLTKCYLMLWSNVEIYEKENKFILYNSVRSAWKQKVIVDKIIYATCIVELILIGSYFVCKKKNKGI